MAHWKRRETLFDEYELTMILAGRWQSRPSGTADKWTYRSAENHREYFMLSREALDGAAGEEEACLRRVVIRHRRAMELSLGRVSDLEMGEPEYAERFGAPSAEYWGESPSAQHRFRVLFLCPPGTIWTLLYDAFRLTPEQAEAQARALFGTVELQPF